MNKKTRKMLIIVSLIIILILVIILIVKYNQLNSQDGSKVEDAPIYTEDQVENQGKVALLETRSEFYMVRRVIQKYYTFSQYLLEEPNSVDNKQNIYSLFCQNYIEEYSITQDNIIDKASKSDCDSVYVSEIYKADFIEKPSMYFVKGLAVNVAKQKSEKFNIIVIIDKNTEKAGIILYDYMEEFGYNDVKIGDSVNLIQNELNNDNTYYTEYITELDYVEDMFNEFKYSCIYYPEYAYEKLDENVKESKFSNYEDFLNYVTQNKTDIFTMNFGSYVKNTDGYKCITESGKELYIKTNGIGNYKVLF